MRLVQSLGSIDRRLVHILVAIMILVPLVRPIGLPLQISAGTQAAFDAINRLPDGALVLFSPEMAASNETELWPTAEAWLVQLLRKNCTVIMFFTYGGAESPVWATRLWDTVRNKEFPEMAYGEQVVILPYRTGQETAIAAAANDFRGVYPEDYYNTPIAELPAMTRVETIKDFDLLAVLSGHGPEFWVRQIGQPHGVPIVKCCTGITAPGAQAYLAAGQIEGLVGALAGGAEYEILLQRPGRAASAMDAQSATHALTLALMLIGNISGWIIRRARNK